MKRKHHMRRRVAEFTDKYPFIGPIVWVLSVQYFVVQWFAAAVWMPSYSWRYNVISDLGNTACGPFADRFVCSPQHALMNASFIILGITMALGSLLIYTEFKRTRASFIGFVLMGLAGFGTVLVGASPENTNIILHGVGAFLALAVGNVSLIVLSLSLRGVRPSFRIYTFLSGSISVLGFLLFASHAYIGLGPGTIERLVSYPQTIWLMLFGLYMCATRLRARRHRGVTR